MTDSQQETKCNQSLPIMGEVPEGRRGSAFLISAATSNSGKTTFTMGLLRALRDRGLRVQPYKCGPDYIDTMFHHLASGRESVNLDTFMASTEHVRDIYERYGQDADVRVVEGVMGLSMVMTSRVAVVPRWQNCSTFPLCLLSMPSPPPTAWHR